MHNRRLHIWFKMLRLYFLLCLVSFSACYFNLEELENEILRQDIAEPCKDQLEKMIKSKSKLIVKMIDSSSKGIFSGQLSGNLYDLAFYDECISSGDDGLGIYGKYCLISEKLNSTSPNTLLTANQTAMQLKISEQVTQLLAKKGDYNSIIQDSMAGIMSSRHFGVCIPDKCDSQEIKKIFPHAITDDSKCSTKLTNTQWETKAIITMIFLCCIIVVAIISTIYDVYIEYKEQKPIHGLLLAFSFYSNGKKLISYSNNPEQLGCLNGLRTLNMMWVIFGHAYFQIFSTASLDNYFDIYGWLDDEKNMIVLSAFLSVDSFLTIGGLLTVYVYMKARNIELRESFMQIPWLYVHRYLRLTPAFGIIMLVYGSGLIKYVGDGPKWYVLDSDVDLCATSFWKNLLYIHNYSPARSICVGPSWYLGVDFQLFLLAPFVLIPLKKWPKPTLCVMSVLAVIGMIIPFCIGYSNKISGVGLGSANLVWANDYYYKTYTRFSPYIIGMVFGYFIYQLKHKKTRFVMSTSVVIVLWVFTIAGHLISIFDGFKLAKNTDNAWEDGIYMGLNKPFWSLSISVLILLCSTGYGGPINTFLSWPMFQFMAKLSYSMYLIHYMVYEMYNVSARVPTHFSNYVIMTQFFANFVITFPISLLNTLVFESPMAAIIKLTFPSPKK